MRSTRRRFLQQAAGLPVPYFLAARRARAESPNDRLGVGSIGVSTYHNRWGRQESFDGRGSVIGHQAGRLGNMVACCDVNQAYCERFAAHYDGRCAAYGDFRRLLERKDIDVVTIGTPDHWHTTIAIAALKAGKDVYCEKPLTLTIDEGRQIAQVARQTGRVFQVGTQQRSEFDRKFLQAVALARSGRLGKKLSATSSVGQPDFVREKTGAGPFPNRPVPKGLDWDFWLGQAPLVPYCPQRCDYDFRWWLEYSGGQVTDWGVHHTDIALWALAGESAGIVEAAGVGEFPKVKNGYSVAVRFDCTLKLANGNSIRLVSGPNELIFEGAHGRIRVNRGGLTGKPIEQLTPADHQWLDQEVIELYRGKKPGDHMGNFFECVKDRSLPVSDVFSHIHSVNACHMANIAMRLGRKVRWDPAAKDFVGDAEASAMRSRRQRAPYTIARMAS